MAAPSKKWKKEELQFLKNNYAEHGLEYCAKFLGKTVAGARIVATKLGLGYMELFSETDLLYIEKFFPIFGIEFCSEKLNISIEDIRKYIAKENIQKTSFENVCVTDHLLEFIGEWNPHFVYILGLIWADGCLTKIRGDRFSACFSIISTDAIHVESCLSYFGIWKWKKYILKEREDFRNGKIYRSQEATRFALAAKTFGQFLFENDYYTKSTSSADKILSLIPENLKHYWWRGFFEGDGHLKPGKWPKIQIAGNIRQDWSFLKDLLDKLNIEHSIYLSPNGEGGSSQVSFGKINDVITFCEYIWQGRDEDEIGFKRKYETFKNGNFKKIRYTSDRPGVCFYIGEKTSKTKPWYVTYKRKSYGSYATEAEAIARIEEVEKQYETTEDRINKKNRKTKNV